MLKPPPREVTWASCSAKDFDIVDAMFGSHQMPREKPKYWGQCGV